MRGHDVKIFFATDIHGSDRCFRKFVNAGKFYGADVLIMGGDITGKMLVPIVQAPGGRYRSHLFGRDREVGEAELPALRKTIADAGFYAYDTTPDEIAEFRERPELVEETFRKHMHGTLAAWMSLAEERLAGTGIMCLLAPGNDDPLFVDDVLGSSDMLVNPDGRLVELPGGFTMISVGYSNPTPWDSPRELPEDRLAERIDREAAKVPDMSKAIFNLHVPPKDTPIDQAMALDAEFRPVLKSGSPVITGVGSQAVRDAMATYQPLLGLHGHIHESRGEAVIGRSRSINPGSEYSEGVLRGALITLSTRKGVRGYQLVAG
ncbi:metallophosphoesterase [Sphaerisporangium album]|uniref:Metallophosphoesterase n=1 Tax=Sphaerisporangium album TaxID=509200 RepID=A0A367FQ44_9ACTN|nr:metallophosphoesterase [Sphaerisporangium album]RCG32508.1 metallophosphoesterase [Sphaerisporangium album]